MSNAITVRGLVKRYGAIEALRGVDLDVREGEIFGLIGPDGAGKTSMFQILGGVLIATVLVGFSAWRFRGQLS